MHQHSHPSLCYVKETEKELETILTFEKIIAENFPNIRKVCGTCMISHVRLFATPWTVACQAPLSMDILQARILEWVAISFSKGSSQPRDQTQVSALQEDSLLFEPPGKPYIYCLIYSPLSQKLM